MSPRIGTHVRAEKARPVSVALGNPYGLIVPLIIDDGDQFPADIQMIQGQSLHNFANPFMRRDSPRQEEMAEVLRTLVCPTIQNMLQSAPEFNPEWENSCPRTISRHVSDSNSRTADCSFANSADRQISRIVTFYSYKGGVGRTSAMANIAVLLAKQDKSILLMDWDLEAPGLDRFFSKYARSAKSDEPGLIHLLSRVVESPNSRLEIIRFRNKDRGLPPHLNNSKRGRFAGLRRAGSKFLLGRFL